MLDGAEGVIGVGFGQEGEEAGPEAVVGEAAEVAGDGGGVAVVGRELSLIHI